MKAGNLLKLVPGCHWKGLRNALALVLDVDDRLDKVTIWDFNEGAPEIYEWSFAVASDIWEVDNG